jgi:CheY-like chemotaxis protein
VTSDAFRALPIVIYTGREWRGAESQRMERLSAEFRVRDVRSPERLLDETAFLLHRNVARLPERQRRMLETLHLGALAGKKALLVDDDIRNIFAMTSVLERFKMEVVSAENGRDAIRLLTDQRDFDIVLMDIMLPTMDGYSTIRAIREIPDFAHLPVIAVTAKAMKGDREKCLAAGASDYLCKPVDIEQLRSTMRLWLQR